MRRRSGAAAPAAPAAAASASLFPSVAAILSPSAVFFYAAVKRQRDADALIRLRGLCQRRCIRSPAEHLDAVAVIAPAVHLVCTFT
jgi:hypothetical protein